VPDEKIPLPFIVVNTNSSAVIQCDMSKDRTDVMFDFTMPFEINDDNTILKKMGM
jgi:transcription factor Dp-1